ncbi:MAG: helix-turn-helix transcriptional regulator [Coriobacteriales bacterium]|jgi:DNA-binding CsgD family transcriptional regulator|nr:helix-turn-helix transcriptional regulator [Coriobacteriales bacterium]
MFFTDMYFKGNAVTILSTSMLATTTLAMLIVVAVICFVQRKATTEPLGVGFLIAPGCLFLLVVSQLQSLPLFYGVQNFISASISGFLTGTGLGLIGYSVIVKASRMSVDQAFTGLLAVLFIGAGVFFIFLYVVPKELSAQISGLLPLLAGLMAMILGRKGVASAKVFNYSISRGPISGIFEKPGFIVLALLGGFLLAYCYNIYPKHTRLVEVYGHIAYGQAGFAGVVYIAVILLVTATIYFIFMKTRKHLLAVIEVVLVVAFAVQYFILPSMIDTRGWLPFIFLESMATFAAVFVLIGCLMFLSSGDARRFFKTTILVHTGFFSGSLVGLIYMETVATDPAIRIPLQVSDILIVGTPFVGFVVFLSVLMFLSYNVLLPTSMDNKAKSALSLVGLDQRCSELAETYKLTAREKEILILLAQGRSGAYVAEDLYLAKSTIKTHIHHIYAKMGIASRQQLIDLVLR